MTDLVKQPAAQASAGRRYKEIVAGITAAADALRERDRERAAELAARLVEIDARLQETAERAALTRYGVDVNWESALEALWVESWLKLRPMPGPDRSAAGADIDACDAAVEVRAEELRAAVRRRFGLPGR
ncbi:hypothetical protein WEH80_32515 [Actinomycetes bacterium KLBMP 9759]